MVKIVYYLKHSCIINNLHHNDVYQIIRHYKYENLHYTKQLQDVESTKVNSESQHNKKSNENDFKSAIKNVKKPLPLSFFVMDLTI
jgi:hypothetical protein